MTKDEIKKALECCCGYEASCDNCPNAKNKGYGCRDKLLANAHNLINEQEKENELLKMQLQDAVNHGNTFLEEANKFEAENKKLKAENKQAKIDVLNRLKERYGFYSCYSWGNDARSLDEIIDEFIKEIKTKYDD